MRLTILSYVGNEEDVIEAFARHHARIATKMLFVTTGTDGTGEILRLLAAEGLPIEIRLHRPAHHDQHEVLSTMLADAAADADWVMPLDADEFLTGPVADVLPALPADRPILLPWRTYVPLPTDDASEANVLRRITHRRAEERPQFRKVLIPAGIVTEGTSIARGNHALEDMAGKERDDVALAHVPVRTSAQLLGKIRAGWTAVRRNPARLPDEAAHWRMMHDQYGSRDALSAEDLRDIALRYAMASDGATPGLIEDPVPSAFALAYTA